MIFFSKRLANRNINSRNIFLLVLFIFLYFLIVPKIILNNFHHYFQIISLMIFLLTFLKSKNMNKKIIFLSFVLVFLLYQAINLKADDNTYINSSNITYNEEKNIVELAENSKINFKNTNILIDKGVIDYNKNSLKFLVIFIYMKN